MDNIIEAMEQITSEANSSRDCFNKLEVLLKENIPRKHRTLKYYRMMRRQLDQENKFSKRASRNMNSLWEQKLKYIFWKEVSDLYGIPLEEVLE